MPPAFYNIGRLSGGSSLLGRVEPTYSYKWAVRRNNAIVLKEGALDLYTGRDKIEITGDQPEMLYVAIEPVARLVADDATPTAFTGGSTGRDNGLYAVGAAVPPNKIGLATPRPSDFNSFWSESSSPSPKSRSTPC